MLEISIPMNINFTIDGEFNIVNIAEKIQDMNIGNEILHLFIQKYSEIITNSLCGEKYQHNKSEIEYERAGTCERKITTILGETKFKVDKIRNKITGKIFKPVLDQLKIKAYKNYQEDISFVSADIATKNTYRDTIYVMKNFIKNTLSPSTINRRVIDYGKDIKDFMQKSHDTDEKYEYFYADGTKSHSQEPNTNKNDIKVAITTNTKGEKILLSCNVNKTWTDTKNDIDNQNILTKDATLISDAEPKLKNTLTKNNKDNTNIINDLNYQLDYIHFIRDIGFKLWQDGELPLETRKKIQKQCEKIIYTLKNQTQKYKNKNKKLKKKINQAVKELKKIAHKLKEINCKKTAKFIKKYSNHIVTYAILQTQGKNIPWNSNIIERLMGEIQKRCKHKWMRWTTQGQESILNLILTRYTNPQDYEKYKNTNLKKENLNNIQAKIII
jgi:hypothetical protein